MDEVEQLLEANLEAVMNADEEDESSDNEGSAQDTDGSDSADLALAGSSDQMREQLGVLARKHHARGDLAMLQQQWQYAVHEFAVALKYVKDSHEEAVLFNKRSRALSSFCKHLRSIPARTSEHRALYGHDPTHLAQLALRDAEKAAQLIPNWTEAISCRGEALFLLERYSDAESAYREGLALNSLCKTLQEGLKKVQEVLAEQESEQQQLLAAVRQDAAPSAAGDSVATAATATAAAAGDGGAEDVNVEGPTSPTAKRQRRLIQAADRDDFECILCLKLLFEPVTTPCGHTFCKGCFARSMDHGNRCPICRTVLHVSRELPITITLQNIVSKAFPAEYATRAQEALAAAAAAGGGSSSEERLTLPLFVMSALLPGEKIALNIFEPRYRLMVRRVMEGNRRFGMATVGRTGPDGVDELAAEAEITDCQMQPDGRYYLEIAGRRRIKITQCHDLDGYRVATAIVLKDAVTNTTSPTIAASASSQQQAEGTGIDVGIAPAAAAAAAAAEAPAGAEPAEDSSSNTNGSSGNNSIFELVDSVMGTCDQLVERLRSVLVNRRVGAAHIRELFDRLGDKPPKSDPEAVSWWAGRLLLLIAPSNSESWLRRELMAVNNTQQRLHMLQEKLSGRLEGAGIAACTIM